MSTGTQHTLLVGATSGLGRSFAIAEAESGHLVSVVGLADAPDSLYQNTNGRVRYWLADLSDEKQVVRSINEIIAARGGLHRLVFFQRFRGSGDSWSGELDITLTATHRILDLVAGSFCPDAPGSIVMVCSVASHYVVEEQPASYHVAKAGLRQLARYYAVKLGPARIRVNCVTCGAIIKDEAREYYHQTNPAARELNERITPLGRMGTPQDVVDAIQFLCSPQAAFITGHDLLVDGGLSLRWPGNVAQQLAQPPHP